MSKYVKSQTRKMLSSYGGVGSILETPKGALLIEEFDKWRFFKENTFDDEQFYVEDNRLLSRLQSHFKKLEKFIAVPSNVASPHFVQDSVPEHTRRVASARYFPEWFYCPNCERFKHLRDWWKLWRSTFEMLKEPNISDRFIPPKCYHCFREGKQNKKGKYSIPLEQVRFIMTAPNGDMRDLPWGYWNQAEKNAHEEAEDSIGSNIRIDFSSMCCDNQDLRYVRSETFSDLAGIRIKCVNSKCPSAGREVTLSGLFGFRIGADPSRQFKPVIRTSSSVYYPVCLNSIYLPKKSNELKAEDKVMIRAMLLGQINIEQIFEVFKGKYNPLAISEFVLESDAIVSEDEITYRSKEFNFIINNPNYSDKEEKNNLSYASQPIYQLEPLYIENLIQINRLKLTTVQTAFTRQEPFDKDLFIREGDESTNIKLKYTSSYATNTRYLVATESFGEGLFVNLNKTRVHEWFDTKWRTHTEFVTRLTNVQNRLKHVENINPEKFCNLKHLAKFILVHTLSHLLMKELEFLCGYSAASLAERLFVDEKNMQAVLIYTVAGAEGSFGGLTAQSHPEKFRNILESALFRAADCSSDPVCYHSDAQGVAGLNLGACYSCALMPETACEEFNCFLDRAILIDSEFGFFKS